MVQMRDGRVGVRGWAVLMIGRSVCRVCMYVRHPRRAGDRQHSRSNDEDQSPEHAYGVYEESSPWVKRESPATCRWRVDSSYPSRRRALAITTGRRQLFDRIGECSRTSRSRSLPSADAARGRTCSATRAPCSRTLSLRLKIGRGSMETPSPRLQRDPSRETRIPCNGHAFRLHCSIIHSMLRRCSDPKT